MLKTHKKYTHDSTYTYFSYNELKDLKNLCAIIKELDKRNCIPATSGNFSLRAKDDKFFITRSGYHKKFSTPKHFLRLNLKNIEPVLPIAPKPSDETKLHATIYNLFPHINAILHCHPSALDSLRVPDFKFPGHELLKALGFKNHEESFTLPVFKNRQDMNALSDEIKTYFSSEISEPVCAFHLEKHGIYCFGVNPQDAFNKLEVFLYN